jgi:hypothetical protein
MNENKIKFKFYIKDKVLTSLMYNISCMHMHNLDPHISSGVREFVGGHCVRVDIETNHAANVTSSMRRIYKDTDRYR